MVVQSIVIFVPAEIFKVGSGTSIIALKFRIALKGFTLCPAFAGMTLSTEFGLFMILLMIII